MTIKKTLQITVIGFVVIMAWVLGGINAIPIEGINEPIELQLQPVSGVPLNEPNDIQHAAGYKIIQNNINLQK